MQLFSTRMLYPILVQSQSKLPVLGQLNVLVVDSDRDSRMLCQVLLEEYNATVLTASSASQALSIAARTYPHVMISSLRLPQEDGYTLIQKIRSLRSLHAIGFSQPDPCFAIALDTSTDLDNRDRAFSAGYQAYFTKPFSLDDLLLTVEIVANRLICHLRPSD
jgi:CheY-like chemotaxis protein